MQVSQHNVKIEQPFSIPLPEGLPSSFFYCGEFMSQLSIGYKLKANLVGLKPPAAGGLPEGTVVYGAEEDVVIRGRDPPTKQGITQEQTGATKGALGQDTGPCTVSGHFPSDVAQQKGDAKLVLFINNAQCKKMVKKTQLKVHRKITAKGMDISGQQKEWTDDQVIAAGEFNSPVAKQDPNISTQDFSLKMDRVPSVETEKNRYFMAQDFETGREYSGTIKNMQQEWLPSITSSLINIDYQVEAQVYHEATLGLDKSVPPLFFPIIVGRAVEGPLDVGTDGMVATQMAQQQQFYAAQVMQPGQAVPMQVDYGYQADPAAGQPPMGVPQGVPMGGAPQGQAPVMPPQGQQPMQPPQGMPNAYPTL